MEQLSSMNHIDQFILALLSIFILIGLFRGLIKEVFSLLTWSLAIMLAVFYSNALANYLLHSDLISGFITQCTQSMGDNATQSVSYAGTVFSFMIIFVGVAMVGSILAYILNLIFSAGILSIGNRILGGVFGLIKGFIILAVLVFLAQSTKLDSRSEWKESKLLPYFEPISKMIHESALERLESMSVSQEKSKPTSAEKESKPIDTKAKENKLDHVSPATKTTTKEEKSSVKETKDISTNPRVN